VAVPAGRHTVRFAFDPLSLKIGAIISGLTLVIIALVIGLYFYRRRASSSTHLN
jgi:uncharacterized membrane protein YfhO